MRGAVFGRRDRCVFVRKHKETAARGPAFRVFPQGSHGASQEPIAKRSAWYGALSAGQLD